MRSPAEVERSYMDRYAKDIRPLRAPDAIS